MSTVKKSSGLKRDTMDKFYTSINIVEKCVNIIRKYLPISYTNDLIIEPSAGNGVWLKELSKLSSNIEAYDLEPKNSIIKTQDYLTLNTDSLDNRVVHVIGNPPFGRQSSTAIKFIKKSVKFSKSISFILPLSFKKSSLQKHFPLNFHLCTEYILPENSFLLDDTVVNVPCVFQIWIRRETKRPLPVKESANGFRFVKKTEPHDISIRRVGVYTGEIDTNTKDKNIQSHYFIKFNSFVTDEMLHSISNIQYNTSKYTCGPKSISKQDIIREFNKVWNSD